MEEKKIIDALIRGMTEGVHIVDRRGVSIVYSPKMAEMEKVRPEDVLGKDFREAFPYIPENESTLLNALQGRETIARQQTFHNVYGKEITTMNTTLPIRDGDEIIAAMELARDITEIKAMSDRLMELQEEYIDPPKMSQPKIKHYNFYDITGQEPGFLKAVELARRAARSEASVFLYGETGTGKELFAQSIHYDGIRKRQPFLAQNCAALPASLLEGILFGTAKGGFTGAVDRAGLFEQANGGTLLLDEISAMPYELQSKLLRVLQENYIRRVGGTRDIPVDVRIIATVNEKPAELIARNALRSDLFYRLAVINIEIPPLRERKEDIPLLVERFLDKSGRKGRRGRYHMSDAALAKLGRYDYPGNVRELENIVLAATALVEEDDIEEAHIRFPFEETGHPFPGSLSVEAGGSGGEAPLPGMESITTREEETLPELLRRVEEARIRTAMESYAGNITRAAASLGIKRQGLQYKLRSMDLPSPDAK